MEFDFHKISLDDKEIYKKYAPEIQGFFGWEYNFAMTWIWNVFDETKIFDAGDMAFVRTKFYDNCVYFPPMLRNQKQLKDALRFIEEQCARDGCDMDLRGLIKSQVEELDKNRYEITSDRGSSDYIYDAKTLRELSGKKFHGKRNHIARFCNLYKHEFRPYNEITDYSRILALYKKWDAQAAHETLDLEEKVITRALDAYKSLGLKISVLCVGERIAAFSVNVADNPFIAHTFLEKADTDFDGAYQTINQKTAQEFFKDAVYVNRQEDMNIEGIRKAKLSYRPVMLLDKYRVQLKKKI